MMTNNVQFGNTAANPSNASRLLYGGKPYLGLDQLETIVTPEPMGRFHRPVPFYEFASATVDALDNAGLEAVHQEYEVTNEGNRIFGALEIQPKALEGDLITADDWKLIVGLRGSHDQTIKRGLVLGSQVMVCSNMCFSGDLGNWSTKQTTNVNARLPGIIADAIARIPAMAEQEALGFDRMRNTEIRARWGDAALVELHRRGALPGPQLTRAIQEWHEPTHAEHVNDSGHDWSAWRLFNASTEALKPSGAQTNPHTVEQRSRIVRGFMNEIIGL